MIYLNLFGEPNEESTPPDSSTSETSIEAARSVEADGPRVKEMIWGFLDRQGEHGGTDDEIQEALGMDGNTERPKRIELWRSGFLRKSGRKRPTATGRKAHVWVTSKHAKLKAVPAKPAPRQNRLPLSPTRQKIEQRSAERERSHGPRLDGMPGEELETLCTALPGWPKLFGKLFSPETARLDPVCRRLLLAAIDDK